MSGFRTRRFQDGDEQELNAVYNRVTARDRRGQARPDAYVDWFWRRAPGGPADSWVIETQDGEGWKIVGHHGLCPFRFTLGDRDMLCAKTMSSFLLPEYRDKFLYLGFERQCLREADARFDATYSVAPGTARLRKSFGYRNYGNWISFERGFHPLHLAYRSMSYLAGHYSYPLRLRLQRALAAVSAVPRRKPPIELVELDNAGAASSRFFADFWTEARLDAGMAPRRDAADLDWRFWKNPFFEGVTLTYSWPEGGRAFCVIETWNPLCHAIADIFITPANAQRFEWLLDALFAWCAGHGALALRCLTTPRGAPPQLMEVLRRKMSPCPLARSSAYELPRRFSPQGKAKIAGDLPDWNTTELLISA
jgi:hypothetical protein